MADSEGNEICVGCIWTPALYDQVLYLTPEPLRGPCTLKIAYDETNKAWLDKKPRARHGAYGFRLVTLSTWPKATFLVSKAHVLQSSIGKQFARTATPVHTFYLLLYMPATFFCAFNTKKNLTRVDRWRSGNCE